MDRRMKTIDGSSEFHTAFDDGFMRGTYKIGYRRTVFSRTLCEFDDINELSPVLGPRYHKLRAAETVFELLRYLGLDEKDITPIDAIRLATRCPDLAVKISLAIDAEIPF